ncbi:hypothetical protein CAPTEDRAFT_200165 [Capitella teleta]|uniref:Uncharacterized protein n=1 Tax=Capitella teleta TaxID=283909 RepID=R7UHW0_CAPTE|nr:hypothetical protein CAPTEDRAFT_200165 [Capitella teleta]|eukprot:ELU05800.1 hypothetical protein CAPTEDRAFT_200165 [Capitella teleta]
MNSGNLIGTSLEQENQVHLEVPGQEDTQKDYQGQGSNHQGGQGQERAVHVEGPGLENPQVIVQGDQGQEKVIHQGDQGQEKVIHQGDQGQKSPEAAQLEDQDQEILILGGQDQERVTFHEGQGQENPEVTQQEDRGQENDARLGDRGQLRRNLEAHHQGQKNPKVIYPVTRRRNTRSIRKAKRSRTL